MTYHEFQRLSKFDTAKRNSPLQYLSDSQQGRRHVKGRAKGVGQVLKNTHVRTLGDLKTSWVTRR